MKLHLGYIHNTTRVYYSFLINTKKSEIERYFSIDDFDFGEEKTH